MSKPSASPDGARRAVESYVRALNSRSVPALMHIGNVPDEDWSRREAARILAADGGKDLKITDVRIDYDIGPNTGSAELTAKGRTGATLHDTFTVLRTAGAWHVVIFDDRPLPPGKESSSAERPSP
ncbi:hypothetical protein ABZ826_03480 [Streptomyces sp. NPDC047515]|uniref:hypothetical protein n=1 Tax=Streptomyces sp. NPDC047515 TaxID=3155380 RepID=UPI0033FD4BC5